MPDTPELPKKLDTAAVEARLQQRWAEDGIYHYDPERPREETFAIDTPPPTVSGSLHVGHVFSYTHTDLVARYQRMRGRNVFYPMGWDDNGVPTERRVQYHFNVRCDPSVPYDESFVPDPKAKPPTPVGRRQFTELCDRLVVEDEKAFEELWRRLGLSVDWRQTYTTVDAHCRRVSQLAFVDLARKGHLYSSDAPSLWDVDFRMGVSQADVEDREQQGNEYLLDFGLDGGATLPIMTTRPELLAACVGVVVHPDDDRFREVVGRNAVTPGFKARVPVRAHEGADPDKGTGAVMVCTYGDVTDVGWRDDLGLQTRVVLGRDGRLLPVAWGEPGWDSDDPAAAQELYDQIAGLTAKQAKARIAELLGVEGKPVGQVVKYYEKGDRPLEVLPTRQWFIRLMDKKDELLAQGARIEWRPPHMRVRYDHWVEGLKSDWNVSRQRFFGVPVPVWYRVDDAGEPVHDEPIWPEDSMLPVDPMADVPPGFTADQRDVPGGFTGDRDVFDTWATSSLTPQIATGWATDDDRFARTYPMDVRPQAHEIIRTWAFYTIARAYLLDGSIPWENVVISGWVLDPDRKKMSKSKGNVVTPMGLLEQYGSDAVRYWSARARLGTDTAYDESVFKIGRRLVTKVFNAAKLVVGRLREAGLDAGAVGMADVTHPLDMALMATLAPVVTSATEAFDGFETAVALERTETWFWSHLTDNYLELSKERAYAGDRSALATWTIATSVVLRLLAPFLPFVTEEAWGWHWDPGTGSIHRAPWPGASALDAGGDPAAFAVAVEALGEVRRIKSERDVSIRHEVASMQVRGPAGRLAR
ncbi:MAG: valine--tRNA ligase, partial [Acidimicrobiia bacterium]|nr:valine--tRNA ligase [Acidimicrobiia bacterium]